MLILLFYNCLIAGFIIVIITCNYNYFYYFCYYCVEGSARLVYGDTDCFNNCHSLIIINSPRIIIIRKRNSHDVHCTHLIIMYPVIIYASTMTQLSCIHNHSVIIYASTITQLSYMHPQSLSYHICSHNHSVIIYASTVIYTVHPQSLSYHASTVTQ